MNWRKIEEKNLFIEKGSHISFGSGEYKIRCSKGTVWLTWPWSADVILNSGEEIFFRVEGTLCMKAFTGALVNVKRKKIIPCAKNIPRLIALKIFTAALAFIKDSGHGSVFGGSVHSITR